MVRIQPIDRAAADGDAGALLDGVKATLGGVPNIFATFARAPKVLEGFLAFNGALSKGVLPAALREQIALTIAGANHCDYCASAHTAVGKHAGLDHDELARNLRGESQDSATRAVLGFVRKVVDRRGRVEDADISALRGAGYGDDAIVEIIAHVGLNLFTNYFNHIAGTDIDFPVVRTADVPLAA